MHIHDSSLKHLGHHDTLQEVLHTIKYQPFISYSSSPKPNVLGFKCVSQVHFGNKSLFDSLVSALRGSKIKHKSYFRYERKLTLNLRGSTSQHTVLNISKFPTEKLLFLTFTLKP